VTAPAGLRAAGLTGPDFDSIRGGNAAALLGLDTRSNS
jgi:hypothetical protein